MFSGVWVPSLASPGRGQAGRRSEEVMDWKLGPIMTRSKSTLFASPEILASSPGSHPCLEDAGPCHQGRCGAEEASGAACVGRPRREARSWREPAGHLGVVAARHRSRPRVGLPAPHGTVRGGPGLSPRAESAGSPRAVPYSPRLTPEGPRCRHDSAETPAT